jgi:hypothetical protein
LVGFVVETIAQRGTSEASDLDAVISAARTTNAVIARATAARRLLGFSLGLMRRTERVSRA